MHPLPLGSPFARDDRPKEGIGARKVSCFYYIHSPIMSVAHNLPLSPRGGGFRFLFPPHHQSLLRTLSIGDAHREGEATEAIYFSLCFAYLAKACSFETACFPLSHRWRLFSSTCWRHRQVQSGGKFANLSCLALALGVKVICRNNLI